MKSSYLYKALLLPMVVFSLPLAAQAIFPVPADDMPRTVAQTWQGNAPDVDLQKASLFTPNGQGKLGYSTIKSDDDTMCDRGHCSAAFSLRLNAKPDFSVPANAIKKSNLSGTNTLESGIYDATQNEVKIDEGQVLTINGPTTLYVKKLTLVKGEIVVVSGNPDDLIIIGVGDETIDITETSGTLHAHIFSEGYLHIKDAKVVGSVTTNKFKMDEGARLHSSLPSEEVPLPSTESCPLFPSPLLSNNYFDGKPYASKISMSDEDGKIYLDDGYELSFNTVEFTGEDSKCVYEQSRERCLVSDEGFDNYPVTLPEFKSGTEKVECSSEDCHATLIPGSSYAEVKISGEDGRLNLEAGEYWIERLILSGENVRLQIEGNDQVVIHYKEIILTGEDLSINGHGSHTQLFLIGHGENSAFLIKEEDFTMKANVYIESAHGMIGNEDDATITGSIAAQQILFAEDDVTIFAKASGSCNLSSIQPVVTSLEIFPNNLHLTCDSDNSVYVVAKDSNGSIVSDLGDARLKLEAAGLSFSEPSFNANEQAFEFTIESNVTTDFQDPIPVTASIEGSDTPTAENVLQFTPFKFSFDASGSKVFSMTAGKTLEIAVQALACDSNNTPQIATGYEKTLNVNLSSADSALSPLLVVPQSVSRQTGASGLDTLNVSNAELKFVQGEAKLNLLWKNVGLVDFTLEDSEFNCTGFAHCPMAGNDTLKGEFSVKSKPDRFVACTDTDSTGTSSTGVGFVAAGALFDMTIKPAIWGVSGSDVCANANNAVPSNYAAISDKSIALSVVPHSPDTNSATAPLEGLQDEPSYSSDGYQVTNVKYTDVGSFTLTMKEDGYFKEDNVSSTQNIGRFYPAYYTIISNQWHYPNAGDFVYMDQPFVGAEFKVQAFNADGQALENISHKDYAFRPSFGLEEVQAEYADRFKSPIEYPSANWSGSIGHFGCGGSLFPACSSNIVWTKSGTKPSANDKPFNGNHDGLKSQISINKELVAGSDPVAFKDGVWVLSNQPDIRYGRAAFLDVSTSVGQSTDIPLRVEYWNGNSFVTNKDDNTTIDAVAGCSTLWPTPSSSCSLDITGTVSAVNGASNTGITVAQTGDASAQQNQVTINLNGSDGSNSNALPWLQYDWDNDGTNDNPSAIVTFGANRGNDRVIFRGEPNQ